MRPSSLLHLLLLACLSNNVLAQRQTTADGGGDKDTPAPTNKPAPTNNQNTEAPAPTNAPNRSTANNNDDKKETSENNDKPAVSATNKDDNPPPSKTTPSNVIITPTGKGSGGNDNNDSPDLSSGVTISGNPAATDTDGGDPPPPKYTPPANGRFKVPDYPPAAVPNTKNAPYMQRSDLPDGTVFIAVGAALALIGLIAIVWRMIVAWQLRRSIRKANLAAPSDSKAGLLGRYTAPSATKKSFYSAGAGSSLSLDQLGTARSGLGQTPNASLFFSPTAHTGSPVHQNRGSAYLPAGYYAPAASPGMGFNQSRDSLPRPRPATRDSPALGTPPASPLLTPQARRPSPGHHHATSVSSRTSLGVPPGGRTPSTYLEDMLDIPFPEDTAGMTEQQIKRSSRRKSAHSGYNGAGSRR